MSCQDCGIAIGVKVRIDGRTRRLCGACLQDYRDQGAAIENHAEWLDRRDQLDAERALEDR